MPLDETTAPKLNFTEPFLPPFEKEARVVFAQSNCRFGPILYVSLAGGSGYRFRDRYGINRLGEMSVKAGG